MLGLIQGVDAARAPETDFGVLQFCDRSGRLLHSLLGVSKLFRVPVACLPSYYRVRWVELLIGERYRPFTDFEANLLLEDLLFDGDGRSDDSGCDDLIVFFNDGRLFRLSALLALLLLSLLLSFLTSF